MESKTIPEDVKRWPAGPAGNGFLIGDILVSSVVGSDGNIYVRKNNQISVEPIEVIDY